jgi:hypothetical protein
VLFASYCEPGSSPAAIRRTAGNLLSTLDTDRSGKLSFDEFAFRFGRKLQMELARKRRAGAATTETVDVANALRARVRETPRETATSNALPPGAYTRSTARSSAPPFREAAACRPNDKEAAREADRPMTAGAAGWSRESLIVLGIIVSLVALLVVVIVVPAPGEGRSRSRAHGRTRRR